MKLKLVREIFTERSTIGTLLINGIFFCYTLEDPVRDVKVWGETAIPEGEYEVVICFSHRHNRLLPLLIDVPNFAGVRIHWGNKPEDTAGCVLVGAAYDDDWISSSRPTFDALFEEMRQAVMRETITITVCSETTAWKELTNG